MKTPMITNDKEFIAATYHVPNGNSESTFLISSHGNDALYEKYANKLNKKRDRGQLNVIYFHVKENNGKTSLTHIIDMHPGGNVPSMVKGKMSDGHKKIAIETCEWIKKNC